MKYKKILGYLWQYVALLISLVALVCAAHEILPRPSILETFTSTREPVRILGELFFVNGLYSLLFLFIAINSKQGGWRLYLALCTLYIGVGSIMPQMETLLFNQAFPLFSRRDIFLLILSSSVIGLVFSAIALTVTKRWFMSSQPEEPIRGRLRDFWPVITGSMVIYPFIYFLFGYFVAYGNNDAVQFYSSTNMVQNNALLFCIQIIRGGLWALCALPFANLMKKREHTITVITGGFILFTAMGLIFENPVMPEGVRYAHGFELTSSMTLLGLVLSLWITRFSTSEISD